MREEVETFLKEYITAFAALGISGVELLLFGSQARGTATIRSDVDIAAVMEGGLTVQERGMIKSLADELEAPMAVNVFFTTQAALDNAAELFDTNTHIKNEGVKLWP